MAEGTGSFRCYCGNTEIKQIMCMGAERDRGNERDKSWHRESREKDSTQNEGEIGEK